MINEVTFPNRGAIAADLANNETYSRAIQRRQSIVANMGPHDFIGDILHGGNIAALTLALGYSESSDAEFILAVKTLAADRHTTVGDVIEVIINEREKNQNHT